MRRNALTLVVGLILLLIFFLLLFTFQVRQTELVIVTTFAKPSAEPIDKPGLYFKWPLPIQRVIRFDKRIHNFEDDFDQMLTRDGNNILGSVFVGWTIQKPREFFNRFPAGTAASAEPQLKAFVRNAKLGIVGQHVFGDFISSDPKQIRFTQIEDEMLNNVRQAALDKYGVDIRFVRFKKLGLPEAVTGKVFDRMTAERQREVEKLKAEGEREAIAIKSAANRDRDELLYKAQAEATRIKGEADAQAQNSYAAFNQNQDFAVFLLQLQALERTLNNRSTLIVDPRTSPFNLMMGANPPTAGQTNGTSLPAASPQLSSDGAKK